MSKRYSVKMHGPDGEKIGAVQATEGQMVQMFKWLQSWSNHAERAGRKKGFWIAFATSTVGYILWVLADTFIF